MAHRSRQTSVGGSKAVLTGAYTLRVVAWSLSCARRVFCEGGIGFWQFSRGLGRLRCEFDNVPSLIPNSLRSLEIAAIERDHTNACP
jgi:hypothetical protein